MTCEPCRDDADRWLDYRAPRTLRIHTVGESVRNILDAQRSRADDHYALIRRQRALIFEQCAAAGHDEIEVAA